MMIKNFSSCTFLIDSNNKACQITDKALKKKKVLSCTKFHFRRYSTLHNIKIAEAALVRTTTSIVIIGYTSKKCYLFADDKLIYAN